MGSLNTEKQDRVRYSTVVLCCVITFLLTSGVILLTKDTKTPKKIEQTEVAKSDTLYNQNVDEFIIKQKLLKNESQYSYCLYDITYNNIFFITSGYTANQLINGLKEILPKESNLVLIHQKHQSNETN